MHRSHARLLLATAVALTVMFIVMSLPSSSRMLGLETAAGASDGPLSSRDQRASAEIDESRAEPAPSYSPSLLYPDVLKAIAPAFGSWLDGATAKAMIPGATPGSESLPTLRLAPLAAKTVDVTVAPGGQLSFSPDPVTINAGDTVRWTWGSSGHSVTSGPGSQCAPDNKFGTNILNAGAVFSHTFDTAGTYPYFCSPHCSFGMTGTINVIAAAPSPTPTPTPAAVTIQFSAVAYSVGEGDRSATISVTRSGDSSGTVSADFATSDGTAPQRSKYVPATGTLTFGPGEINKSFNVLVIDEGFAEGNETVNLSLSNPTGGATLGSPGAAVLTIIDNDAADSTTNPLDNADAQFFVREQYLDFLNREPDAAGFAFWTSSITQCGSNTQCLHDRRIAVADAFFFEPEFQDSGAYVYRLYKAAFGVQPTFAQFSQDRPRVVGGTQLDQSKTDFAAAFVQRQAFTGKYSPALSGPDFVDAVLKNIRDLDGVDLTASRTDILNAYNTGADQAHSRGLAMRKIAEIQPFIDSQYNESFVVMEYFGYLRRDPDIGGQAFWLGQVSRFPLRNVDVQHAMACSFITSSEYQKRFSPVTPHTNQECPQ